MSVSRPVTNNFKGKRKEVNKITAFLTKHMLNTKGAFSVNVFSAIKSSRVSQREKGGN